MAKDEKSAEPAPAKGGKKKLIMIAAIALVVLVGGGVGGYLMLKPKKAEAEPAPTPGVVSVLDAITINLADGHYLKLKMTLQATTEAAEAPDGSEALDIAIDEYSGRKMDQLMSNAERERTKKELIAKVVKAYTKDGKKEIMDIYFTTFVIQ
ncbi:flagellar basal body-associated FliL family protein [Dactylosporangium vinaceum]|uniref:Flagellar protein FliL n=2 Tax=Dactylosporangium TaxID=35753 RepID=A0ABV5M5P4_9ACTN|nr:MULTISPECIES: flagellar basal body-associated FliL family protein [Dactylosporangium]UAC01301.1 flagellar basal body-associated FliL family protein [Dactylosporangium vinaceum]UWZ48855.1 flagellar basal body-associated FliL family protein [Dactylosporangium matsuzakiense]